MRSLLSTLAVSAAAALCGIGVSLVASNASAQTTVTTTGGTSGRVAKFTGAYTIGNSVITESSGKIGIDATSLTELLNIGGTNNSSAIRIDSANCDSFVEFWGDGVEGPAVGLIGDCSAGNQGFHFDGNGYDLLLYGGNVGIGGTVSPSAALHVQGDGVTLLLEGTDYAYMSWYPDGIASGRKGYTGFAYSSGSYEDDFYITNEVANHHIILSPASGGRVGIATAAPSYMLHVSGSAGKPGGGNWTDSSDRRLKRNIRNLDGHSALNAIARLQGVTFEWINTRLHGAKAQAGFVAQDVEMVFPDWVEDVDPWSSDEETDADLVGEGQKVKALTLPTGFNAYLVEAVKELKSENEYLKQEVSDLKMLVCADHPEADLCYR